MKGIVLRVKSPKQFDLKKNEISYFIKRYGIFTMFLISILIGMISGIYAGAKTNENFRLSFDFLFITNFRERTQQDLITFFCSSFSPAFMFFIVIFLLGFCPWGNVIIPFVTAFRGFGTGLTLVELCSQYGVRGFIFFILTVIPGFFLFSASIAMLSEQAFYSSVDVFDLLIRKKEKIFDVKEYSSKAGTYLLLTFLSSLTDTVLFIALFSRFSI